MTKTSIVTGANGQLGQEFVSYLISNNYFVYAIDIELTSLSNSKHVQMVSLDITNSEAVLKVFLDKAT